MAKQYHIWNGEPVVEGRTKMIAGLVHTALCKRQIQTINLIHGTSDLESRWAVHIERGAICEKCVSAYKTAARPNRVDGIELD